MSGFRDQMTEKKLDCFDYDDDDDGESEEVEINGAD